MLRSNHRPVLRALGQFVMDAGRSGSLTFNSKIKRRKREEIHEWGEVLWCVSADKRLIEFSSELTEPQMLGTAGSLLHPDAVDERNEALIGIGCVRRQQRW